MKFRYDANGNRVWRHVANDCYEVRDVSDVFESDAYEMKVFPNPTKDQIKIVIPSSVNIDCSFYELYNLNGVKVKEGHLENHESVINIETEEIGVYLLKVFYGYEVKSKIILKQ
ncbi:MAG: T9SS type A sorting domain-containing protein [Candidatus Limimorpha sp.]